MLQPADVPNLNLLDALSDEDRQVFPLINNALENMLKYMSNFYSAVHLFEYCGMQNGLFPSMTFVGWMRIAARDAVMSIYHFRKEMLSANNLSKLSQTIGPHLNKVVLHKAHSIFETSFPDFEPMRHAVAHAGELGKSLESHERHSFSGDYIGPAMRFRGAQGMIIQDQIEHQIYTATYDGAVVHCEITLLTWQKMVDVLNTFYEGFRAVPGIMNKVAAP